MDYYPDDLWHPPTPQAPDSGRIDFNGWSPLPEGYSYFRALSASNTPLNQSNYDQAQTSHGFDSSNEAFGSPPPLDATVGGKHKIFLTRYAYDSPDHFGLLAGHGFDTPGNQVIPRSSVGVSVNRDFSTSDTPLSQSCFLEAPTPAGYYESNLDGEHPTPPDSSYP